jgi:hypothetical protein
MIANNVDIESSLDRVRAMVSQETTCYTIHDYLAQIPSNASRRRLRISTNSSERHSSSTMGAPIDASCRLLMAKWCNSLADFCQYDKDITASAMSCVDRYAATSAGMKRILLDRDQYQLAVMTALYMVAKIQQTQALDPASVAKLSRGKYCTSDIETMELEMLVGLKWRVNPPTPWTVARELLKMIPTQNVGGDSIKRRIDELTKYQIDAAVCDYQLSLKRPSEVAFGAILNAMESLNADYALHFETAVCHLLQTSIQQLQETRTRVLKIISEDDSKTQPNCALLTQRMRQTLLTSSSTIKGDVLSSVNTSPKSVSASFRQSDTAI